MDTTFSYRRTLIFASEKDVIVSKSPRTGEPRERNSVVENLSFELTEHNFQIYRTKTAALLKLSRMLYPKLQCSEVKIHIEHNLDWAPLDFLKPSCSYIK